MTTTLTDAAAPRAATRTPRVFVPLALLAIVMAAVAAMAINLAAGPSQT